MYIVLSRLIEPRWKYEVRREPRCRRWDPCVWGTLHVGFWGDSSHPLIRVRSTWGVESFSLIPLRLWIESVLWVDREQRAFILVKQTHVSKYGCSPKSHRSKLPSWPLPSPRGMLWQILPILTPAVPRTFSTWSLMKSYWVLGQMEEATQRTSCDTPLPMGRLPTHCVVHLVGGGVWAQGLGAALCLLNLTLPTMIGAKCEHQEGDTRTGGEMQASWGRYKHQG